jgi:hypothetical protein
MTKSLSIICDRFSRLLLPSFMAMAALAIAALAQAPESRFAEVNGTRILADR